MATDPDFFDLPFAVDIRNKVQAKLDKYLRWYPCRTPWDFIDCKLTRFDKRIEKEMKERGNSFPTSNHQ